MIDLKTKLADLGWTLPTLAKPVATYVPVTQTGNLLIISGQLPMLDGKLICVGKVGRDVTLEVAQKAAGQCVVNALAAVNMQLEGNWTKFKKIVRLGVFVQSADDFYDQALVANGASELLGKLFGDAGQHARAAVGCNTLPLNSCVEIEMMVEII